MQLSRQQPQKSIFAELAKVVALTVDETSALGNVTMGIRVVARVRPQHKNELEKDIIVSTAANDSGATVKIPNPKKESETYAFQFSGAYDQTATQQEIYEHEISPTIKSLFNGLDVTIFAYGSTGTGKTHTMRGGKSMADRGMIPRFLSGVYRRARKIVKDSDAATKVEVSLSYYEIYNDKVFDLFESPEDRTAAGLPLRDNGGKTVVVGLTERPCESLKEFETLYDQANVNRSTGATKLNASSSRSHAILRIKVSIMTGDTMRSSVASAIDLAGSEDNRRTENRKDRMVESASINKSLFTLAKCVEAISRRDDRIPYRESKMTRILSLGQNNGVTVMILNLAPVRSFHLDTLSSLTFANRTRKIEVREIENEPVFRGCSRPVPNLAGTTIQRQPLRPLASTVHNIKMHVANAVVDKPEKQLKASFSVFSDPKRNSHGATKISHSATGARVSPLKRRADSSTYASRPAKRHAPGFAPADTQRSMSKQVIEDMIERKVSDILAARALDQPSVAPQPEISEEVQRRLDMLEKRIEGKDEGREQGLSFLLMGKQHAVRGEDASALRMYRLAKDFFPDNAKLQIKIDKLQDKLRDSKHEHSAQGRSATASNSQSRRRAKEDRDSEYAAYSAEDDDDDEEDVQSRSKAQKGDRRQRGSSEEFVPSEAQVRHLLDIINSGDLKRIRRLKRVGAKKADMIMEALADTVVEVGASQGFGSLSELGRVKGVGMRAVETMIAGIAEG